MKLPKPPKEVPLSNDLKLLAPKFVEKLHTALEAHRALGHDPIVFEAIRTNARQAYLYGFGRSYDDGRGNVTGAKDVYHGYHGYGLAVDVISKSKLWNASAKFWSDLEQCVEKAGLTSGRDWDTNDATKTDRVDNPHVQWRAPNMPYSAPNQKLIELLKTKGREAVWKEVGAI